MVLLIGKRSGIFLCSEADTVFNIRERKRLHKKSVWHYVLGIAVGALQQNKAVINYEKKIGG